jgi:integrase
VAGAVSTYEDSSIIGGFPGFLTSRAVIFRDATGAHGAFLETTAKIAAKAPALKAAGLEHRGPYAMRHTFASWAIAAGLPTFEIAATMGTSLDQLSKT